MARVLYILNGPNLNALGKREPGIYGGLSLADIEADCLEYCEIEDIELEFRQTNHEGILVDWLQEAGNSADAVAINPGAYGHTSIAIHDAIRSIEIPVVEVHLSNVHAREEFRKESLISPVAAGVVFGFGPLGYRLALQALNEITR